MNMDKPVKIGKISYINASPVYYGLDHGLLPSWLTMVPDVPSALNRQIMTGQVVASPISAAFYAQNYKDLLLLSDLSISCHGKVLSVLLASQYPIDELTGKTILFSKESASAASFLKMIFRQRQIEPVYEIGNVKDSQLLSKTTQAVLVIGDTALTQHWKSDFSHCIDLGELWFKMTGLPFVFAVWAVRRDFAALFPERVQQIHQLLIDSKGQGDIHSEAIVQSGMEKTGLDEELIREYFNCLHCDLDEQKIKAMKLFFDSLHQEGVLKERALVEFY